MVISRSVPINISDFSGAIYPILWLNNEKREIHEKEKHLSRLMSQILSVTGK